MNEFVDEFKIMEIMDKNLLTVFCSFLMKLPISVYKISLKLFGFTSLIKNEYVCRQLLKKFRLFFLLFC